MARSDAHASTRTSVDSFIVASSTQLAARMEITAQGTYHARCPYCGKDLELHDNRWMIPAASLGHEPITAKTTSMVRRLATSLVDEGVPITLFSTRGQLDAELLSLKELGIAALPSDFGDSSFTGLYRCDVCGRGLITWHSLHSDEIPLPFVEISIESLGQQIQIEVQTRPKTDLSDQLAQDTLFMSAHDTILLDIKKGLVWKNDSLQLYSSANATCSLPQALNNYDIYTCVARYFPQEVPLPQWSSYRDNALILALATRFQGYPESFYQSCCEYLDLYYRPDRPVKQNGHFCGVPFNMLTRGLAELPLYYKDIPALFERTTLPNTKSIRRLAFENPLIIAAARCCGSLPFSDANLLRRFLASKEALYKFAGLGDAGGEAFWKEFARQKGAKTLVEILERLDFEKMRPASKIPALNDKDLQEWLSEREVTLTLSQARKLRDFAYLYNHGVELEHDYEYSSEQQALSQRIEEYEFVLPKKPFELFGAGRRLHNCLVQWANNQEKESTVVLVSKSKSDKPEAAIEVNLDSHKVFQAKLACNEEIPTTSALHEAIEKWAHTCELEWEQAAA